MFSSLDKNTVAKCAGSIDPIRIIIILMIIIMIINLKKRQDKIAAAFIVV